MMACECGHAPANTKEERKTLRVALVLNATMFVVGMAAGLWAQSSGLMADALDMLTDATAYALGPMAVTRGMRIKQYSARWVGGGPAPPKPRTWFQIIPYNEKRIDFGNEFRNPVTPD